jgi:hypothetical protein
MDPDQITDIRELAQSVASQFTGDIPHDLSIFFAVAGISCLLGAFVGTIFALLFIGFNVNNYRKQPVQCIRTYIAISFFFISFLIMFGYTIAIVFYAKSYIAGLVSVLADIIFCIGIIRLIPKGGDPIAARMFAEGNPFAESSLEQSEKHTQEIKRT